MLSAPGPAEPVPTLTFASSDRAAVLLGVTEMLRDQGYAVDRADYRFGVVTTEPRDVGTFAEPLPGLAQPGSDGDQAWAATVGHLRRTVRVTAQPIENRADREALRVEVQVLRYAAPQRRVINASRGRVFSSLSAVPEPWAERGLPGAYWYPTGRDVAEERRLLQALRSSP